MSVDVVPFAEEKSLFELAVIKVVRVDFLP